jgi:dGTPase
LDTIRERFERFHDGWLVAAAARSRLATRPRPEQPCAIRTDYQRDRDRVIHSQAFRRLKSKTQVFLPPSGDHVRTRLTHTLEVTQIARSISRALGLNEDLTEAIALAHDLGHTPFGHAGEEALASVFPGFRHNEQSLRVVDILEKDGAGLNLTHDTRDGILRHSKPNQDISGAVSGRPATAEGQVVKISDGIAYISHDLEDALSAGKLHVDQIPRRVRQTLGERHSERIDTLVRSVIASSRPLLDAPVDGRQVVLMRDDVLAAADDLRGFLFHEVYDPINRLPSTRHAMEIVVSLFEYYACTPDQLPPSWLRRLEVNEPARAAADFVSGMTDEYARRTYHDVFVPSFEEL